VALVSTEDVEQERVSRRVGADELRKEGGRLSWWTVLLLSALAAALMVLAFPPYDFWPGAPLSVALLVGATRGRGVRASALPVGVVALGFMVAHLSWSGEYVGWLPHLGLSALSAGLMLPLALLGRLQELRAWPVWVTGLWVGVEALRSEVPFGGFPWGRLAFSQSTSPVLGWAAVGGAPLVSAVVVLAGCLLALGVRSVGGARAAGVLATGAVLASGALVPRASADGGTTEVALVQGNVPEPGLDFNEERRAVLENHAGLTRELGAEIERGAPRPEVVLWPENSSDVDPLADPEARRLVEAAADAVGVPVLVGAVLSSTRTDGRLENAGLVVDPGTGIREGADERYVKQRPAPFGEYVPARSFFRVFSDKVDLVRRDFAPGEGTQLLGVGPVVIGDVICFEVAFDDVARDAVRGGAELLVVQTNNATFGYSDEAVQQLAMSRLRAVELGRSVAHVSTVGVSAVYAPDGTELARGGHFTAEVLRASAPAGGTTLATGLGNAPQWVLVGLGGLGAVMTTRRARGRRRGRAGS
jgi:apolipoprotein N-acyltransferase